MKRNSWLGHAPFATVGPILLLCAIAWGDGPAPSVTVTFSTGQTDVQPIKTAMKWFLNRVYRLRDLPDELNGMQVTRRNGKSTADLGLDIPAGMTVYLIIDSDKGGNASEDGLADLHASLVQTQWTRLPEEAQYGPVAKNFFLTIYKKTFPKATHVELHSVGFNGISVVAPALTVIGGQPTTQPDETSAILFGGTGTLVHVATTQASIGFPAVAKHVPGSFGAAVLKYSLAATVADHDGPSFFRFSPPASSDQHAALDAALHVLGSRYSNFDAASFDFSLSGQSAGENDPAIAVPTIVLLRSIIEGFEIDPQVAIAGNVDAEGKLAVAGAVALRMQGADSSKTCKLVLLPLENYEQLVDFKIYNGLHSILGPTVIGFSTEDDAVDWARTDRQDRFSKAIEICTHACKQISASDSALHGDEVVSDLHETLDLAPNCLTARLLLALSQNKARQRLSIAASEYFILAAAEEFLPDLFNADPAAATQPTPHTTDAAELQLLHKVRPIADLKIQPLVDAWSEFIRMQVAFNTGKASYDSLTEKRQALWNWMQKLKIDQPTAEGIVNQGM